MRLCDTLDRPLRSLRISVTDRCNLRCRYCMPQQEYVWIPRAEILTFEEIGRLVDVFAELGVDRVRLTGGEPLLRHDLPLLIQALAAKPALRDLSLTTNGVLLPDLADTLAAAGLQRFTISLDTLRPERFAALTRGGVLDRVLAGIAAAGATGLPRKINTVVMHGFNDDELVDLIEFGRDNGAEVRFIEYMDVGGAVDWSLEQVVTRHEMLARFSDRYGSVEPLDATEHAPAERFRLPDGTVFGIIGSTTTPFCRTCDRSRITADGTWLMCLYARDGLDLRGALRGGISPDELRARITDCWRARTDRGAEERRATHERGPFVLVHELRRDYHLEMHKRGG